MGKRTAGSGGLYQRASDGLWVGSVDIGRGKNGKRRRKTVTAKTRTECRAKLNELRRDLLVGVVDVTECATVGEWLDEWLLMHVKDVRPRVYGTNKSTVERWIRPALGRRRLDEVRPADVRRTCERASAHGLSVNTVQRIHRLTVQVLRAARVEGHPVDEGVFLMRGPRSGGGGGRLALSREQVGAVLGVAGRDPGLLSRWGVALLCGLRQGEALGLQWSHVDLDAGVLDVAWQLQALPYVDRGRGVFRVPRGFECVRLHDAFHLTRPKSLAGVRVVPLPGLVVDALREWQGRCPVSEFGLVWARPDGRCRSGVMDRREWGELQSLAGVVRPGGGGFVVHECRHTAATLMLDAGGAPEVIRAVMGHSDVLVQRGYQHVDVGMSRRLVEVVGGFATPSNGV